MLSVDPSDEKTMIETSRTLLNAYYSSNILSDSVDAKITRISGGLTNALFKIDFPNTSVLVRIFGAEGMIDRDLETATFARLCGTPHDGRPNPNGVDKSSRKVVHPDLDMIGRFANGRIESWIPNMKQSTISDFDSNLMGGLARALARLHYGFEVPSYLYKAECRDVNGRKERIRVLRPNLWEVIYSWINELEESLTQEKFDADLLQLFCEATLGRTGCSKEEITTNLQKETQWLQSTVQKTHPDATVAFTHNDLCTANILLDQSQDADPCIIDYEYGSINYTMYDVANFFCELCGGNDNGIPNTELFPTMERQKQFLKEYVTERKEIVQEDSDDREDDVISHLQSQIQLFQMASNLMWGIWGVLQASGEVTIGSFCKKEAKLRLEGKIGEDSFDYLRYGMNRLKNYRICKNELS
jgi:ethanolamine kinase